MNIHLKNALDSLRSAGAISFPDEQTVENSPDGKFWKGQKKDGDQWYLVKHSSDSYNVQI